ncbi:MAG: RagB/SusD family nutrient uptake outer membrane protein [Labilibaculum sp.]|nr:RagB/SusD family nutrient uptake outer membrane protein [Labilibaculum sp.]MBI9057336.1 RagB/SusD family nutrient uptake outer membrane protein [Labilibaculum sp.]
MKKINIISILLLFAGLFACTDLKEEPYLLAPESFFKTKKDVEAGIFGAYGHMAAETYWGRKFSLTIMLRSDMVDIGNRATPSRRVQINDFTSDAYSGMTSVFWPRSYQIISAANSAIAGAEGLAGELDETTVNELIAEARFIRSFAYFNLVRLFGDIPYIGEAVSDPESLFEISKTSKEDVYANIVADLEFAKANLPMTQNSSSRAKRASAYAMLADVHLTLENWSDAYANAKWVIDNAAASDIDLEADYQDLFDASKHDGMKEHLFTIDFLGQAKGGSGGIGVDYITTLTGTQNSDIPGWGAAVPSMAVYNDWDDRDYRKSVAFLTHQYFNGELKHYSEFPTEKRPHIDKYNRFPGNAGFANSQSDINYAVYRYADVLLMAAEAGNEVTGPNAELEGYVDLIRERARNAAGTMNDFPENVASGLSKDEFRDMVLEERRLELSFEFKRWWDISRRKLGDKVFKGTNSLEPHDNFNDTKYLLALPQDELDRNPNLLPQNQGYN